MRPNLFAQAAFLLLCCGVILASPSALAQGAKSPSVLPATAFTVPMGYEASLNLMPTVSLVINGHKPMVFGVDTGSECLLLLSKSAATELGIKPEGITLKSDPAVHTLDPAAMPSSVQLIAAHGKQFDIPVAGDCFITDFPFETMGAVNNPRRGIVGLPFLRLISQGGSVQFDFRRKQFLVSPPTYPLKYGKSAAHIPVSMGELNNVCVFPVQIGADYKVDMTLDTGSVDGLIPTEDSAKVHPLASNASAIEMIDGYHDYVQMLVDKVQVGQIVEPDCIVGGYSGEDVAVLGMGFISRFLLTIDFHKKELVLERAADYAERKRLPGQKCLGLDMKNGQVHVFVVSKGTTAAQSGLQTDDVIHAADGVALNTISEALIYRFVCGREGTTARLVVQRGSTKREIHYKRHSLFSNYEPVGTGIETQTRKAGLFVSFLGIRSPAQEAGLHINDEIVEVNGQAPSVEMLKQNAVSFHTEGTKIRLKIRREGETKLLDFAVIVRRLLQ